MQATSTIDNQLSSPSNRKCGEINKSSNSVQQKNFINGIHNAFSILQGLEHSFRKSGKYEQQLLQCKAAHSHSHDSTWWESDKSEKSLKYSNTDAGKTSRNQVDLAESWSTMSIVCLQYQYEELSKRYALLLQAYDERCTTVTSRDAALAHLRRHLMGNHAQLTQAHKALLKMGDMYLALRTKRNIQRSSYQKKINRIRCVLRGVVEAAERSRLEFDARLSRYMADVRDSSAALLLHEMRKCNLLSLDNLRLRAQLEVVTPGRVECNK